MDSDYCLICGKHTLGGVYCSQTCRMSDLEAEGQRRASADHLPSTITQPAVQTPTPRRYSLFDSYSYLPSWSAVLPLSRSSNNTSAQTSPNSSPQFAPTKTSNLPSLPLISALERLTALPSSTASAISRSGVSSGENTSIWRNRRPLRYGF